MKESIRYYNRGEQGVEVSNPFCIVYCGWRKHSGEVVFKLVLEE